VVAGCFGEVEKQTPAVSQTRGNARPPRESIHRPTNAPLPSEQSRPTIPRDLAPDDWFADVTEQFGVKFAYHDGGSAGFYTMLEQLGGGVAMIDYDQDDDMDLFFTGGGGFSGPPIVIQGRTSALFRNDGRGNFENVTEQAGFHGDDLYTHGCTVADYDNDGFPDLFVAGYRGSRLYHNGRDGRFLDVTASAGLDNPGWNTTAAWGDFDRDGFLDLYVATYAEWEADANRVCTLDTPTGPVRDSCSPRLFAGQIDRLWRNRGDGTFEEKTTAAGLTSAAHRGLGVVTADFDDDGWIDLYVVNDIHENELYFGGAEFSWTPAGLLAGCALSPDGAAEGSMGVDLGDFNGDGRIDLFYTNFAQEDNSLLQYVSDRGFANVTEFTGLARASFRWVGFGTGWADFDSDGWQDLFVSNGHVHYGSHEAPYFQPAQLFRNLGGDQFEDVSRIGGPYFSVPHAGRGAAVGDLNNDGALDLVFVNQNDPVAVLENRKTPQHWIRVRLIGTTSNRDAIGAEITTAYGDRKLTRWVRGGGGYLSHFDSRIVFPRRDDSPAEVIVKWPTGSTEVYMGIRQGQTCDLVEGRGRKP
jgi:hypothetical protein